MQAEPKKSLVGEEYEVEVGPVAHGGHCIARTAEGQVLFVRHTLPGERVVARVTEGEEGARFLRADAVRVLEASKDRIEAPCPYAGPGRCGGCDWQHAKPGAQRRLKGEVVEEQLRRLAGLTPEEAGWDGCPRARCPPGARACSTRWTPRAAPDCAATARTRSRRSTTA
jgi:tRNA/tmRNA/rRNA uracil-C5-methylase (TrmA/RlmC/RlmD family)